MADTAMPQSQGRQQQTRAKTGTANAMLGAPMTAGTGVFS